MSAFLVPKGVLSTLERILRNFFWEGHNGSKINQLVKWETVNKSIADGGLGLGSFKAKNLALLAKWGWQYMEEEDALWHKVVRSIHDKSSFN